MSLAILQLLKKKCKTPMGCVSSKEGKTTVKLLQIHLLLSEKKKENEIIKSNWKRGTLLVIDIIKLCTYIHLYY